MSKKYESAQFTDMVVITLRDMTTIAGTF